MRVLSHVFLMLSAVLFMGANQPQCAKENPEAKHCQQDSDCGSGQVCEPEGPNCGPDKVCVDGCREHSDCANGETCDTVMCVTCPCPGICTDNQKIAQEGENCGDDIQTQCEQGLYCAFGLVECGTPPVVGTCRTMGACGNGYDCTNENNQWNHDECVGSSHCDDGNCIWICDDESDTTEFVCGDQVCNAETEACHSLAGGVEGSGISYSCAPLPAACMEQDADCSCFELTSQSCSCSFEEQTLSFSIFCAAP